MSCEHQNDRPDELTPAEQAWEGEAPAEPFAAIEQTLAGLSPAPPRIDRDRLMFLAGAASATSDLRPPIPVSRPPNSAWLWPASTAALAATSLALAIALLVRPAPAERIVYLPQPRRAPSMAASAVARGGHERATVGPLRQQGPSSAVRTVRNTAPAPNYVRTRDVALRLGLDALGSFPGSGDVDVAAPTYRSLLEVSGEW